jgi:2-polyprenyl-6-methoxyphenol hydroxylase-like FAD-dependent oxidoreductase
MDQILIAGAGLVGLAVSIGLADLGCYRIHIFEKRPEFVPKAGATLGLAPNGIRALREICPDVVTKLEASGLRIPETKGLMLPWSVLRDTLLQEVRKRSDRIEIHMGTSIENIVNIDHEPEKLVTAIVKKSSVVDESNISDGTEETTFHAALLLGCDGVHSKVREILGLRPADKTKTTVWRGTVQVPPDSDLTGILDKGIVPLRISFGKTFFVVFNFHEKIPYTICWTFASQEPNICPTTSPLSIIDLDAHSSKDESRLARAVLDLASTDDLHNALSLHVISPDNNKLEQLNPGTGWGGRGRVELLGDAAHAMRPASGFGASMAFEDCVVLLRILKNNNRVKNGDLSRSETINELLREFESQRLPRVSRIWQSEWERSEAAYTVKGQTPYSNEYLDWILSGV